jgi:LPXTG-motif cell wall-anchored protein
MKSVAVAASVSVFVASLSLPGLLFAQDQASEEPQTEQQASESPAAESHDAEVEPADDSGTSRGTGPSAEANSQEATPRAASNDDDEPASKASVTVSMKDNKFQPKTVTISVGDSVTWKNEGEEDHTATGSGFATGTVAPGSSASETFSDAGDYSYICDFHDEMKGTVVVEDGGTSPDGDTKSDDPTGTGTDPTGSTSPTTTGSSDIGIIDDTGTSGSSSLPATGQDELPLTIVGLALLGVGAFTLSLARWLELWDGP